MPHPVKNYSFADNKTLNTAGSNVDRSFKLAAGQESPLATDYKLRTPLEPESKEGEPEEKLEVRGGAAEPVSPLPYLPGSEFSAHNEAFKLIAGQESPPRTPLASESEEGEPEEEFEVRGGAEPVSPLPYFPRGELNAFMNTHHFFAGNRTLQQARSDEIPFKVAVGGANIVLQFSAFGPLVQCGGRYNEPGFIEHPIHLSPGEWIREVVVREDFSLLLTSHHRVMVNGDCPFIPLRQPDLRAEGFNECLIDGLKPNERVIKIAADEDNCVLLTSANQVLVCGSNEYGQLGFANQNYFEGFKKLALALLDKDEWVIDVAMNYFHTLLRTNKHRVLASGRNECGPLGLLHRYEVHLFEPCPLERVLHAGEDIKSMAVGYYHCVLLTTSHRILVSGGNAWGQLGLGDSVGFITGFTECVIADLKPGELVEQVAVGYTHTIVLTNHHRLFVCGRNECGQLGLQSRGAHYQFTECPIDCLQANEVIIDMAAGVGYTLLTTSQKRVLFCGFYCDGLLVNYSSDVFTFQKSFIPDYKPRRPEKSEVDSVLRGKTEPAEDGNSRCVMQ